MTRLPFRLLVIVLALAATGALGYRTFRVDLGIGASLDAARRSDQAVAAARLSLAGLDASMRSLVAPGQRPRAWAEETERQLDQVREILIGFDTVGTEATAHPLDGALDRVDQLAASAQRVRTYMESDQPLLAGDVVFNEARGILSGLDEQVSRTGSLERGRHAATLSSLRQEQGLLVGGIVAVWLFTSFLLLPVGRQTRAAAEAPEAHVALGHLDARVPDAPEAAAARQPAAESGRRGLAEAASLCTDLARVTDGAEIARLLERAADVLEASGVIVWVAGPGGVELFPVASHGYDARTVARIGSIRRDAANLTAAAFRESTLRSSAALGSSGAAVAVPLIGPGGGLGVLSAELRDAGDLSPATAALATILSAQLATLVGSMPTAAADEAPPAQQANA